MMMASEQALEEASHTVVNGLLASSRVTPQILRVIGMRLMQDAIEPLEESAVPR